MRNLFRPLMLSCVAVAVASCVSACGGNAALTAQQVGCVTDAALAATSQTVTLTDAQKQAIAAGQAVAFIYCDAPTSASAAAAASAPQASK
jgi:hypothetical protein